MKVKIIAKEALPIAEVNDILVKLEKKGELSGSQQRIRDFTAKFNKINKSEATKLIKDIKKIYTKIIIMTASAGPQGCTT